MNDWLGNVDGDPLMELVICGNSGRTSIIDWDGTEYYRRYDSPPAPAGDGEMPLTQSCSIGDLDGDGLGEVVGSPGVRSLSRILVFKGSREQPLNLIRTHEFSPAYQAPVVLIGDIEE